MRRPRVRPSARKGMVQLRTRTPMLNVKHHASALTFSLPLPRWRPPAQAQAVLPRLEGVLRPQQVRQDPVGYQLKIPDTC